MIKLPSLSLVFLVITNIYAQEVIQVEPPIENQNNSVKNQTTQPSVLLPSSFKLNSNPASKHNTIPSENVVRSSGGTQIIKIAGMYGLINNNKTILPAEYESISFINEKIIRTLKGNTEKFIYQDGKPFFEKQYERTGSYFYEGMINVMNNGLWGVVGDDGKEKIPPLYTDVEILSGGMVKVRKNNLFGMLDRKGNVILPLEYEVLRSLSYTYKNLLQARKNQKYGLLDITGKVIVPLEYDNISVLTNITRFVVTGVNNKSGLYDVQLQKEILPPVYNKIWEASPRFIHFRNEDKYGIIDINGKLLTDKFTDLGEKYAHTIPAAILGKYGYINPGGKTVLPFIYEKAENFNEKGLAQVKINNLFGVIDEAGLFVIEPKYEKITEDYNYNSGTSSSNLKYTVRQNGKYGLIDETGQVLIPIEYLSIKRNGSIYFAQKGLNEWYILSEKGTPVSDTPYDKLMIAGGYYESDKIIFEKSKKLGLLDKMGNTIVPALYDDLRIDNKLIIIKQNGKSGFLNEEGQLIAKPKYDEIQYFSDTLSLIKTEQLYGLIHKKTGFEVLPTRYNRLERISYKDFIIAQKDGLKGLISPTGFEYVAYQFEKLIFIKSLELFTFQFKGKWGAFNTKGEIIITPQYEEVKDFQPAFLLPLRLNGKWGLADKSGKIILPFQYDEVYYSYESPSLIKVSLKGKIVYINTKGDIIREDQ